ncbi:hypothetical protein LQK80_01080 [Bacillus thuringiensis]|nr:hypothetical protein [Bacillus thuringiensis]
MKKFIYITSILIGGLLGSYISLTYAKDATLFEKAGMYFLIFPTIINSCTKLFHKAITGKGEKMKHYLFLRYIVPFVGQHYCSISI